MYCMNTTVFLDKDFIKYCNLPNAVKDDDSDVSETVKSKISNTSYRQTSSYSIGYIRIGIPLTAFGEAMVKKFDF